MAVKCEEAIEQVIQKMPIRRGLTPGVSFFVEPREVKAFAVYAGGPLHVSTHEIGVGKTAGDAVRVLLAKIEAKHERQGG